MFVVVHFWTYHLDRGVFHTVLGFCELLSLRRRSGFFLGLVEVVLFALMWLTD